MMRNEEVFSFKVIPGYQDPGQISLKIEKIIKKEILILPK